MLFGLIGTVVGFIIALSGVDAGKAGDVSAVFPMISTLIAGMSVALYTTLVGSIAGGVWLRLNYHFLSQSAVELLTTLTLLSQDQAKALTSEDAKEKVRLVALLESLETKLTR